MVDEITPETEPTLTINDPMWEQLLELTGGAAAPCFQCGVCTAICPWGHVRQEPFSVRTILRNVQLGLIDQLDDLWLCTACSQCEASCPRGVPIAEVLRSLRYLLWKEREDLENLPNVMWSVYWNNNPLSQPPSQRMAWAEGLDLPQFDPDVHEWLLYIGCTGSYDRRAQSIAKSLVKVMRTGRGRTLLWRNGLPAGPQPLFPRCRQPCHRYLPFARRATDGYLVTALLRRFRPPLSGVGEDAEGTPLHPGAYRMVEGRRVDLLFTPARTHHLSRSVSAQPRANTHEPRAGDHI